MQYSTITLHRELNRLAQTTTEFKFEVTVRLIGLTPRSILTSTKTRHRFFPNSFAATNVHFTSIDEPVLGHQWEVYLLQSYLCFQTQNYFLKPNKLFSVILTFSLMQTANTISSETSIPPGDPKIFQLLATHSDCSKQCNGSRRVSRAGGGWKCPSITIGYSEPTRAESPEWPPPKSRALG